MGIKSTSIGAVTSPGDLADNATTEAIDAKLSLSTGYQQFIAEIAVGVVQALGTAAFVPDSAKADYFVDATGAANTIDTAATTAYFDNTNKKYYADFNVFTSATETTGYALATGGAATGMHGFKILVGIYPIRLTKITKHASCTATKAYLLNSTYGVIASAAFVGNEATFNNSLNPNGVYYLGADNNGASYNMRFDNAASYPIARTYTTITAGLINGSAEDNGAGYNILSFNVAYDGATLAVVGSVALANLNGSITKVALYVYQDSLPTGTALTFDVDYTGDGTYELLEQAPGAWIDLGAAQTFTNAKIRVNLKIGTGLVTDEPSFKGYCFMVV